MEDFSCRVSDGLDSRTDSEGIGDNKSPKDGLECSYCERTNGILRGVVVEKEANPSKSALSRMGRFLFFLREIPERLEGRNKLARIVASFILFLIPIIFKAHISFSLYISLYLISYLTIGIDIIVRALTNLSKAKLFDEYFLMSIATIGAFAIGSFAEGVAVMLFFQTGDYLEDMAINRSKKTISSLLNIRPEYANVLRNGITRRVSPKEVEIGEEIVVKPGERIPLDGDIVEGSAYLDESSLTGESIPRGVGVGDEVYSGTIDTDGLLRIRVKSKYAESTVARILDLVENAAALKSPTEKFIEKFARYYTPVVVFFALALAVVPPVIGGVLGSGFDFEVWIYRALIFLVISCPCALVVSIPLGYFAGIGRAARDGVLVKGGEFLDALAFARVVVFDKTGTLTEGNFRVVSIHPVGRLNEEDILKFAAVGESFSNHPIAKAIVERYRERFDLSAGSPMDLKEIPGRGVAFRLDGREVLVGNRLLLEENGVSVSLSSLGEKPEEAQRDTLVYVAIDGRYAGYIVVGDRVRENSREALHLLKSLGVEKTVMLTGDRAEEAKRVGREVGIDVVHSGLLPDDKLRIVEELKTGEARGTRKSIMVIGDGINDAPMLVNADIGVAMGGIGSDVAVESADVVLMNDNPLSLVRGISIARKTRGIVIQNIVFALGVKLSFLIMGAVGVTTLWEAVFADVGVTLIAILNTLRVLGMRKY